ncbi:Putative Mg2+ and Co2+ transporter CorB [Candidatus Ornithobacterium hominis]|uniref:Mg2+ and Co2+ transporter CorB n=1 Tax=Candidatus Ornithobacterium hominis TaxID=2497989 RepID=A0A383TTX2_9FLAO|nr:hemolysin family protein [Candidatus Ornithobacterium hominis]MCT7903779.1 hemolysin family protein [Candidatus Ornithobacterium hominis]SZD71122.1 Putative Mg2+ and Co2+ transporter CorB [Candidatus Ornithobacterium hominis]
MGFTIAIIIFSLIASAFFSGMEIALISSNRMEMEIEKKKETLVAKVITFLAERPEKFIATMLVGNNIAIVIYGIFTGSFIISLLPEISSEILKILIQTVISTLIILVFAEYLPKVIFSLFPNNLFKTFVIPVFFLYWLFAPITAFIMWITNLFLKMIGKEQQEDEIFVKDELRFFISEQLTDSDEEIIDSQVQIFHNALEFADIKVRECMIPRKEIVAMAIDEDIDHIRQKFIETGYSKIIIYQNNIDNVIGYIHSFDLFKKPRTTRSALLPVEFVNETEIAKEVMNKLIKSRKSVAIVNDEYGGTAGMLTVEDVVEELFGEIEDEHDQNKLTEKEISENEFLFSARLEIDYINEQYGLDLPEDEAYETLGGLAVSILEKIPETGEEFKVGDHLFRAEKVSETKIEEIKIIRLDD